MRVTIELFFFFFQAEDGIRDLTVTGVQTCALPILLPLGAVARTTMCANPIRILQPNVTQEEALRAFSSAGASALYWRIRSGPLRRIEIGRASCRERV